MNGTSIWLISSYSPCNSTCTSNVSGEDVALTVPPNAGADPVTLTDDTVAVADVGKLLHAMPNAASRAARARIPIRRPMTSSLISMVIAVESATARASDARTTSVVLPASFLTPAGRAVHLRCQSPSDGGGSRGSCATIALKALRPVRPFSAQRDLERCTDRNPRGEGTVIGEGRGVPIRVRDCSL